MIIRFTHEANQSLAIQTPVKLIILTAKKGWIT